MKIKELSEKIRLHLETLGFNPDREIQELQCINGKNVYPLIQVIYTLDQVEKLLGGQKEAFECIEHLLKNGADPNRLDGDNSSALFEAVTFDNIKLVEILMKKGGDIHKLCGKVSPFHEAIARDNDKMVEVMLNNVQKRSELKDKDNVTPLGLAVYYNAEKIIQFLTQGNIHYKDNAGLNVLNWLFMLKATSNKDSFASKLSRFKNLGANVNQKDIFGNTPFNTFITFSPDPNQYLDKVLGSGVDINQLDNRGNSPLHCALNKKNFLTEKDKIDFIQRLLTQGADVFQTNRDGVSALELAETLGDASVIKIIKDHIHNTLESYLEKILTNEFVQNEINSRRIVKLIFMKYCDPEELPRKEQWRYREDVYDLIHGVLIENKKSFEESLGYLMNLMTVDNPQVRHQLFQKMLWDILNDVSADMSEYFTDRALERLYFKDKEKYGLLYQEYRTAKVQVIIALVAKKNQSNDTIGARKILEKFGFLKNDVMIGVIQNNYDKHSIKRFASLLYNDQWVNKLFNLINENSNLVNYFAKRKFDFNDADVESVSLLHLAIENKNTALFKKLLSKLSDKELKNLLNQEYNSCPIRCAIFCGANDILKFLLEKGANPTYGCWPYSNVSLLDVVRNRDIGVNKENEKDINEQIEILMKYGAQEIGHKPKPETKESKQSVEQSRNTESKEDLKEKDLNLFRSQKIRRIFHTLGVGKLYVSQNKNIQDKTLITLEGGSDLDETTGWILDFLKNYLHQTNIKNVHHFGTIFSSFQVYDQFLKAKTDKKSFLDLYRQKQLVCITSGWKGHGVQFFLKDGWLSYTNRGAGGDPKYGTKIYKIKDNADIESFISKITCDITFPVDTGLISKEESQNFIEESLKEIVDIHEPFIKFEQKTQKIGNCALANNKSGIAGAECLLWVTEFLKTHSIKELDEKVKAELIREVSLDYKAFTNFMRDSEVDTLISELKSETDEKNKEFYYELLSSIVLTHPEFNKKNGRQGIRICKIWEVLPETHRLRLNDSLNKVYHESFESRRQRYIEDYKQLFPVLIKYAGQTKTGFDDKKQSSENKNEFQTLEAILLWLKTKNEDYRKNKFGAQYVPKAENSSKGAILFSNRDQKFFNSHKLTQEIDRLLTQKTLAPKDVEQLIDTYVKSEGVASGFFSSDKKMLNLLTETSDKLKNYRNQKKSTFMYPR